VRWERILLQLARAVNNIKARPDPGFLLSTTSRLSTSTTIPIIDIFFDYRKYDHYCSGCSDRFAHLSEFRPQVDLTFLLPQSSMTDLHSIAQSTLDISFDVAAKAGPWYYPCRWSQGIYR
jgi:hypothetical protein